MVSYTAIVDAAASSATVVAYAFAASCDYYVWCCRYGVRTTFLCLDDARVHEFVDGAYRNVLFLDAINMVPDFDMSQKLFDQMQNEGEEGINQNVDGWHNDNDTADANDGIFFDNPDDITFDHIEEENNSFKGVYAKSIAPVIEVVDKPFNRSIYVE